MKSSNRVLGLGLIVFIFFFGLVAGALEPAHAASEDQLPLIFTANLDSADAYVGYQSRAPIVLNREVWSSQGLLAPFNSNGRKAKTSAFNSIPSDSGEFIAYRLHLDSDLEPVVGIGWDQSGCQKGPLFWWYLTQEGYHVVAINQSEQMLYISGDEGQNWSEFAPGQQRSQSFSDWGQVYARTGKGFDTALCANLYWPEAELNTVRQALGLPVIPDAELVRSGGN